MGSGDGGTSGRRLATSNNAWQLMQKSSVSNWEKVDFPDTPNRHTSYV